MIYRMDKKIYVIGSPEIYALIGSMYTENAYIIPKRKVPYLLNRKEMNVNGRNIFRVLDINLGIQFNFRYYFK